MRVGTKIRLTCKPLTHLSRILIFTVFIFSAAHARTLNVTDESGAMVTAAASGGGENRKEDKDKDKDDKDQQKKKGRREHKEVKENVDKLCEKLSERAGEGKLSSEQADLLSRCNGIAGSNDPNQQLDAYRELDPNDFVAIRNLALGFSGNQHYGVMNRLSAMRRGGENSLFDLGGLSLNIGGKPIPIYHLQAAAEQLVAMLGSDNADAGTGEEHEPLLSERLGLWLRSNYDWGDKDVSPASDGFDGSQWGLTGGVDYRFGQRTVIGLALGYGQSDVEFRPSNGGGLNTNSWTASLYGSFYPWRGIYVDAVFNYGDARYDTTRHILYSEPGLNIDRTALGETGGQTMSGGISAGYDFSVGGITISPAVGYFHTRAKIDSFEESGAGGLDLIYGDQNYSSSTANISIALNYVWNTPAVVVLPHVRAEYLYELNDDIEVFGVRFANDPFADAADPTPPIMVRSDVPDQRYARLAVGVSAQFKYGFSGYFEYQRLQNFQYVNYQNITLGLRFQRGFY